MNLTDLLSRPGSLLMGILNVTPDSFSDGGSYFDTRQAIARALEMVEEGAEIIDVGGESTRPAGKTYGAGARHVPIEEELRRVLPVVMELAAKSKALISVDTQKSYIANAALQAGAHIVNDVSAGTADEKMLEVVEKHKAPIVLMHGHGPQFNKNRIEEYHYDDIVLEVKAYLAERIRAAQRAGIETVLADVGIGFAKIYEDNMRLIKHHAEFAALGVPMVLGVSRKSSIGIAMRGGWQARGPVHIEAPQNRASGSLAAACFGVMNAAKIIRTHDVKATREALNVISVIQSS